MKRYRWETGWLFLGAVFVLCAAISTITPRGGEFALAGAACIILALYDRCRKKRMLVIFYGANDTLTDALYERLLETYCRVDRSLVVRHCIPRQATSYAAVYLILDTLCENRADQTWVFLVGNSRSEPLKGQLLNRICHEGLRCTVLAPHYPEQWATSGWNEVHLATITVDPQDL